MYKQSFVKAPIKREKSDACIDSSEREVSRPQVKDEMSARLQKSLLGFASGVMVAASVWSLLIPAMEMEADSGKWSVLPAAVGFLFDKQHGTHTIDHAEKIGLGSKKYPNKS